MATVQSVTGRTVFIPSNPVHRKGCPSQMTPIYQVTSIPNGSRTQLINKYTTMRLVHKTKDGVIKNSLSLEKIHNELEICSLNHQFSGASNILLTKVSVDCLVTKNKGQKIREYLTFDLRIPGANTDDQSVFLYDVVEKMYGDKPNLYAALKHFHDLGRSIINPQDHTHGHKVDYNPSSPKHDQYIRHTEQFIVAYLALPEAAEMLCNYLRVAVQSKHPGAPGVKVYNMGLHMHSTKLCCGPCESALIGLMNKTKAPFPETEGGRADRRDFGFLHHFQQACSVPDERLTITFPRHSLFRLLVTVTATNIDADHRAQPTYTTIRLNPQDPVPTFDIDVKSSNISKQIFEGMLKLPYDQRRYPIPTGMYATLAISGSNATPGNLSTMSSVKNARDNEMKELAKQFSDLGI